MLMTSLMLCLDNARKGGWDAQLCSIIPGPGDWRQPEGEFNHMRTYSIIGIMKME